MSREGKQSNVGRVILWLAILVALPAAVVVFWWVVIADHGELVPRSEKGTAYLLIDNRKYSIRDKDRDGKVDCLITTGARGKTLGVWGVEEGAVRCSRRLDALPMSEELRRTLTELMARKFELDASHTSGVDLNGDGRVDCVVSVHDPGLVVLEAPGAQCSAKGHGEMEEDFRREYSRVLALEQEARKQFLGR